MPAPAGRASGRCALFELGEALGHRRQELLGDLGNVCNEPGELVRADDLDCDCSIGDRGRSHRSADFRRAATVVGSRSTTTVRTLDAADVSDRSSLRLVDLVPGREGLHVWRVGRPC